MGTTDLIVMLALFVALAVYGIWKYSRAEDNDYRKFTEQAAELSARMSTVEKNCEQDSGNIVQAFDRITDLEVQTKKLFEEIAELQDHCAKLRRSQIDLRDRSYPRQIEVKFPPGGAIPVEIMGPSTPPPVPRPKAKATPKDAKAMLKKTAKQIKELSK